MAKGREPRHGGACRLSAGYIWTIAVCPGRTLVHCGSSHTSHCFAGLKVSDSLLRISVLDAAQIRALLSLSAGTRPAASSVLLLPANRT